MNMSNELSLAWTLMDSAASVLSDAERSPLCAKIGAGELETAIIGLLAAIKHYRAELSPDLGALVKTWSRGYIGADIEKQIRDLVDGILWADPRTELVNIDAAMPPRLIAKRPAHAAHRTMPAGTANIQASC